MKRPVFCVALAYALGEVIGLYTRTVGEIGIACVMLVCVGVFMRKMRQGKSACVLGLGVGLGMLGAFLRIPQDLREKPDIRQENGYDIITYATGGETQGQPVICAGILTDRQGETWTMRVLDGADVHGDILLRGVEGEHTIAEIVQVTGTYDTFEHVRNPGGFQSRSYYLARNISGYYYAPQVTTITVNQREILGLPRYLYYQGKRILYELRIRADCQIAKLLPEEQASLVSGILLGEKSRIDAELKTLYQMGGIAHILAISGLHISLLGGLLFRLMRRARVPIPAAGIITTAGLLLYGMMTGMSLATMRAIWMMVIFLVAQMFGKSYDMPTAMGIALFFMLLCNPVRILDAGMQLSYMAIAGVSLGNYGMKRLHKKNWISAVPETISASVPCGAEPVLFCNIAGDDASCGGKNLLRDTSLCRIAESDRCTGDDGCGSRKLVRLACIHWHDFAWQVRYAAGWVDVTGIYMALRKDTGTAVEYTCYRRDTRLADWHVVWRDCMHAGIASHKNKK